MFLILLMYSYYTITYLHLFYMFLIFCYYTGPVLNKESLTSLMYFFFKVFKKGFGSTF